jgi:hypothetical protein
MAKDIINMDKSGSVGFSMGGIGGTTNEGIKELFHFESMVDLMQKTDIPSSAILPFMELCNIAYAMESNLLKAMLENYMRVRVSVDRRGRGELERVSAFTRREENDEGMGMRW